jgi:hypothetical protein
MGGVASGDVPLPGAYRVEPGLLAGPYPGGMHPVETEARLARVLAHGVTLFLDLTGVGELDAYADALAGRARHVRHAIRDYGVPSPGEMRATLDAVRAELARGGGVYVHCWGGLGRTGTVVGCWLVEAGVPGEAALAELARLRADTPNGWKPSPETLEQMRLVAAWDG